MSETKDPKFTEHPDTKPPKSPKSMTKAELVKEVEALRKRNHDHEKALDSQTKWHIDFEDRLHDDHRKELEERDKEIAALKRAVAARETLLRDLADEYRTEAAALLNRAERRYKRIMAAFPLPPAEAAKKVVNEWAMAVERDDDGNWKSSEPFALAR